MDLKTFLGAIARHALTTAGGALVAKGVIAGGDLPGIVGAVMSLGGVAWSLINKHLQAR